MQAIDKLERSNVVEGELVGEPSRELTAHERYAKDLRAFAEFYEQHPEVELPSGDTTFYIFPRVDEVSKYARSLGRARKEALGDSYFTLQKSFGPRLVLQVSWGRDQVCERVVTGKKTVTTQVPVAYESREELVEEVEWRCPKVLEPVEIAAQVQVVKKEEDSDVPF